MLYSTSPNLTLTSLNTAVQIASLIIYIVDMYGWTEGQAQNNMPLQLFHEGIKMYGIRRHCLKPCQGLLNNPWQGFEQCLLMPYIIIVRVFIASLCYKYQNLMCLLIGSMAKTYPVFHLQLFFSLKQAATKETFIHFILITMAIYKRLHL